MLPHRARNPPAWASRSVFRREGVTSGPAIVGRGPAASAVAPGRRRSRAPWRGETGHSPRPPDGTAGRVACPLPGSVVPGAGCPADGMRQIRLPVWSTHGADGSMVGSPPRPLGTSNDLTVNAIVFNQVRQNEARSREYTPFPNRNFPGRTFSVFMILFSIIRLRENRLALRTRATTRRITRHLGHRRIGARSLATCAHPAMQRDFGWLAVLRSASGDLSR